MNEDILIEKLDASHFIYGEYPSASITVQIPTRILEEICEILDETTDKRFTKHSVVGYLLDCGLANADFSYLS